MSYVKILSIFILFCLFSLPIFSQEEEVEAYAGTPFGVGKIVTFLGNTFEKDNRIFYPAWQHLSATWPNAPAEQFTTGEHVCYFLFPGKEQLNIVTASGSLSKVTPVENPEAHAKLLKKWWSVYTRVANEMVSRDILPPQIPQYLVMMLAQKLGLNPVEIQVPYYYRGFQPDDFVALLMGTESIRSAMQKETFLNTADTVEPLEHPLPKPANLPAITIPEIKDDVKIEPIAFRVPEECFYMRFGNWSNFQWMRKRLDEWGGNLRDLVAIRGRDYHIEAKIQKQLALKETSMSKLFGSWAVEDVAFIGTDTFVREGSALGILFYAKSMSILCNQIENQRKEAVSENPLCTITDVEIAGRPVSLLSTPDGSVRSFYVPDEDFLLVTNSLYVAKRFIETSKGTSALGNLKEFKFARHEMPLSRQDTLFIYLSDPFFRFLVGPHYKVEMTRRMKAESDLEILQMAMLTGRGEGAQCDSIEKLIEAKYLPKNFGKRSDGSHPVMQKDKLVDSLRGARGCFLPIPDIIIDKVTTSEMQGYKDFTESYTSEWTRMDPVIVGIQRTEAEKDIEQLNFDFHISPYVKSKYQMLEQFLAKPVAKQMPTVPGTLASIEGVFKIGNLLPESDPNASSHGFASLMDFPVHFVVKEDKVLEAAELEEVRTCGGITKNNVILERIKSEMQPDEEGFLYSNYTPRVWMKEIGDWITCSYHKDILKTATPYIKLEDAVRPAQIRLRIFDLSNTKVRKYLDAQTYIWMTRVSKNNVILLQTLFTQFHVPANSCIETAKNLVGGDLVCPMNGVYGCDKELVSFYDRSEVKSDEEYEKTRVEREYIRYNFYSYYYGYYGSFRFYFLDWFHSLNLEFSIDATTISTHLELKIRPNAPKAEDTKPIIEQPDKAEPKNEEPGDAAKPSEPKVEEPKNQKPGDETKSE